jgi:hypothetical protein
MQRRWVPAVRLCSAVALLATALVPLGAQSAAAFALSSCWSSDNGDPVLNAFHLSTHSTHSIDVTSSSKSVGVTVTTADTGGPGSLTGVAGVTVEMQAPEGFSTPVRDAFLKRDSSGNWVGSVTFPPGTVSGLWRVVDVVLTDRARPYYNQSMRREGDLIAAGFDHDFQVTSTEDTTPPALTAFTFTPGAVNTTSAAKTVAFTAHATDDISGVRSISVFARGPAILHAATIRLHRASGTPVDGTWTGTMTIPRWQATSTWGVEQVNLVDRVNNSSSYDYGDLGTAGFKRNLAVTSGSDDTAPSLAGFSRSPSSVDVRTSNKTVSVTVHAKDAGSGVAAVSVTFDTFYGFPATAQLHLASGTHKDGVWKGSATVFRCRSQPGPAPASLRLTDAARNVRDVSAGALASRGFPHSVSVTAGDHSGPSEIVANNGAVPVNAVKVNFNEIVNGITTVSSTIRTDDTGTLVSGSWACKTGSNAATSCRTGNVRHAFFTPTDPLSSATFYRLEINPEHTLGVRDRGGNPFYRNVDIFSTS